MGELNQRNEEARKQIETFIQNGINAVINAFDPTQKQIEDITRYWSEYVFHDLIEGREYRKDPETGAPQYGYYSDGIYTSHSMGYVIANSGLNIKGYLPEGKTLGTEYISLTPEITEEAKIMREEYLKAENSKYKSKLKERIQGFINRGIEDIDRMFNPTDEAMGKFKEMWTILALQGIRAGGNNGHEQYYYRSYPDGDITNDMKNALMFSGISINGKSPIPYEQGSLGEHIDADDDMKGIAVEMLNVIYEKKDKEAVLAQGNIIPKEI